MPDSVKISELAPRAAVGTDVLPAVDATFTSTIRVSASSIAAIGGGPPGDGTVTTAKLANSAVTYPKIQNVAAYKLLGNSTNASAVVAEVPVSVTGFALLNCATASDMRTLIGFGTAFTGQTTFGKGTAAAPSIACNDTTLDPDFVNTNTGVYWPDNNTVGISTEGTLKFYIDGEGTQYSNIAEQFDGSNNPLIRPQYSCRAWVAFNGSTSTTTVINSQSTIAQRYGLTASLYFDGWNAVTPASNGLTVAKIVALELAYGNDMTNVATTAADGRNNYTSPSDNYHWRWNGSSWVKLGPPLSSGQQWIGRIEFKPSASAALGILAQGGVTSVTNTATGTYRINFKNSMPDTNYAVVTGSKRASFASAGGDDVLTRNVAYCDIKHYEATAAANTSYLSVAIFR